MKYLLFSKLILFFCLFAGAQKKTVESAYAFIHDPDHASDTAGLLENNRFLLNQCKQKYTYLFNMGKLSMNNRSEATVYFKRAVSENPGIYRKVIILVPADSVAYYKHYLQSVASHRRMTEKDTALNAHLKKLTARDQFYRKQISGYRELSTTDYPLFKQKFDSLMTLQKVVDSLNQLQLDSIIQQKGWPDLRYVDEEVLNSVFTIAQHCTVVSKREKYLRLMRTSVKNGNDTYPHLAYYTDRTRMFRKKPQLFGTENIIKDNSGAALYPVKNQKKLNQRRIIYGLAPIDQ